MSISEVREGEWEILKMKCLFQSIVNRPTAPTVWEVLACQLSICTISQSCGHG